MPDLAYIPLSPSSLPNAALPNFFSLTSILFSSSGERQSSLLSPSSSSHAVLLYGLSSSLKSIMLSAPNATSSSLLDDFFFCPNSQFLLLFFNLLVPSILILDMVPLVYHTCEPNPELIVYIVYYDMWEPLFSFSTLTVILSISSRTMFRQSLSTSNNSSPTFNPNISPFFQFHMW